MLSGMFGRRRAAAPPAHGNAWEAFMATLDLELWIRGEETSGTILADSSSHGRAAGLNGAYTLAQSPVFGNTGASVRYEGGYGRVLDAPGLQMATSDFVVGAVFAREEGSGGAYGKIVSKPYDYFNGIANYSLHFEPANGKIVGRVGHSGNNYLDVISASSIAVGQRVLVAMRRSAEKISLWINGVKQAETALPSSSTALFTNSGVFDFFGGPNPATDTMRAVGDEVFLARGTVADAQMLAMVAALGSSTFAHAWDPTRATGDLTYTDTCHVARRTGSPGAVGRTTVMGDRVRRSGKAYTEVRLEGFTPPNNAAIAVGVARGTFDFAGKYAGETGDSWALWGRYSTSFVRGYHGGTATADLPGTFSENVVIGIAVDFDLGYLWFSVNGVWTQGDPAAGTEPLYTGVDGEVRLVSSIYITPDALRILEPGAHVHATPAGFSKGWVPTPSADPYWTDVVSYLRFAGPDGATVITDDTGRAWAANGGAQIDTDVRCFGESTLIVNGGSITTPHMPDLDFGSGDFCVELFGYSTDASANQVAASKRNGSGFTPWGLGLFGSKLQMLASTSGSGWAATNADPNNYPSNTFQHDVLERWGDRLYAYRNGVLVADVAISGAVMSSGDPVLLGNFGSGGFPWQGNLAFFKLTRRARYMGPFEPLTAPPPGAP